MLSGLTVLDLGCGTGRDCYVAAQLVGESGLVIGLDMTDQQLECARQYESWHKERFGYAVKNTDFRTALIEDLASALVADDSIDVVMSNCVLNLAPDKEPILREIR
jgi:ubiquinone/menaquinone biosynthesis C-methylase UbiE